MENPSFESQNEEKSLKSEAWKFSDLKDRLIFSALDVACLCGAGYVQGNRTELPYLVANYGNDIALSAAAYFTNRIVFPSSLERRSYFALIAMAVPIAGEIAQFTGFYRGTADPFDILAYTAGAGLAYKLDSLFFRKNEITKSNLGIN